MRLWSISFEYLDQKGLVALWRESLLAQKCLMGLTRGYNNHPQLLRFKESIDPLNYIGNYLYLINSEANKRNYKFDVNKIYSMKELPKLKISAGQLKYEFNHLQKKLMIRNKERYGKNIGVEVETNGLFEIYGSDLIEYWERV